MNPWAAFWALWALAGVVVEALALRGSRQHRDTLSRNIQWLVLRHSTIRRITMAGWLAFSAWFVPHIWY